MFEFFYIFAPNEHVAGNVYDRYYELSSWQLYPLNVLRKHRVANISQYREICILHK